MHGASCSSQDLIVYPSEDAKAFLPAPGRLLVLTERVMEDSEVLMAST